MNARYRTIPGNLPPLTLQPEKLVVPADLPRRGGRLRLFAGGKDRCHDRNVGIDPACVKSDRGPLLLYLLPQWNGSLRRQKLRFRACGLIRQKQAERLLNR